jgi:hypothetical protein
LSATLWQQNYSLGLEDQEGLVASFEQVKEAGPLSVVSDGQGEVLATDDVPASTSVLSQLTGTELGLNFSCYLFVKSVLLVGGLAN